MMTAGTIALAAALAYAGSAIAQEALTPWYADYPRSDSTPPKQLKKKEHTKPAVSDARPASPGQRTARKNDEGTGRKSAQSTHGAPRPEGGL